MGPSLSFVNVVVVCLRRGRFRSFRSSYVPRRCATLARMKPILFGPDELASSAPPVAGPSVPVEAQDADVSESEPVPEPDLASAPETVSEPEPAFVPEPRVASASGPSYAPREPSPVPAPRPMRAVPNAPIHVVPYAPGAFRPAPRPASRPGPHRAPSAGPSRGPTAGPLPPRPRPVGPPGPPPGYPPGCPPGYSPCAPLPPGAYGPFPPPNYGGLMLPPRVGVYVELTGERLAARLREVATLCATEAEMLVPAQGRGAGAAWAVQGAYRLRTRAVYLRGLAGDLIPHAVYSLAEPDMARLFLPPDLGEPRRDRSES